mgnify:CR=1 FL=1
MNPLSSPRYFSVAGIIGAGKTNLSHTLSRYLNAFLIEEPVKSNPYLGIFYEDMKNGKCLETRSAIIMQFYLLNVRYKKHLQAIHTSYEQNVIADRSIFEDMIFVKILHEQGHISDLDFQCYHECYSALKEHLKYPIFIFIDISVEDAMKNIEKRARKEEKSKIPREYMEKLNGEYQIFKAVMENNSIVLTIPFENVFFPEKIVEEIVELDKKLTWQDTLYRKI